MPDKLEHAQGLRPETTLDVLEAWFANAPTDPAAGWTRAELAEHVRSEHSTFSWLCA